MPFEIDYEFGRTAVSQGRLRQEQLEECIEVLVALERAGSRKRLWDVIARKGYMDPGQINELRKRLPSPKTPPRRGPLPGDEKPAQGMESDARKAASDDSSGWDVPLDVEVERVEGPMAIIGIEDGTEAGARPPSKTFAPGDLKLTGVKGPMKGRSFTLAVEKNLIGRDDHADVVISGPSVSRHHAEITFSNGRVTIRDLGSRNGIRVNGAEVSESLLNPGETVLIGTSLFVVEETLARQ